MQGTATPQTITITHRAANMFCHVCDRWQPVEDDNGAPRCTGCGDWFMCSDCGYDVDLAGRCQRRPEAGHDGADVANGDEVTTSYTVVADDPKPELTGPEIVTILSYLEDDPMNRQLIAKLLDMKEAL